jgi:hypothetical protein
VKRPQTEAPRSNGVNNLSARIPLRAPLFPSVEKKRVVDALLNLKDLSTWPTEIIHLISDYSLPLPGIFTFCGFGEHRRAAFLTVDGDMTILASMSCERGIAAAVRIDDNIYVTGGSGDTGTYLSSMERYHLPTRRWSSLPSMSSPRSGHANVRINDDCFMVIGGIVPGSGDTTCEIYNTVTNKWSFAASSTTPRDRFASVSRKFMCSGAILTLTR